MIAAGELRERVTFSRRAAVDDGHGNTVSGPWTDEFTVWARVRHLRGGEEVMASRLSGRQPVVLTVRRSPESEGVTTDWRATDAASGEVYNIRSVTPDEERAYFDLLCERGVAT
jgi:SPP1 family predicted phage head-tail adaptor